MVKATGEWGLIISFICKRPREDVSVLYFHFSSSSYTFSSLILIALCYISSCTSSSQHVLRMETMHMPSVDYKILMAINKGGCSDSS